MTETDSVIQSRSNDRIIGDLNLFADIGEAAVRTPRRISPLSKAGTLCRTLSLIATGPRSRFSKIRFSTVPILKLF